MSTLRGALIRFGVGAFIFPSLLGSCGGRTPMDDLGQVQSGGSVSTGGSGVGGTSASGGAVSTGGTALGGTGAGGATSGGASSGGTGTGGTGSGGTGGVLGCSTPQFLPCRSADNFIYFDAATGQCEVAEGQCRDPAAAGDVFATLAECLKSCAGALPGGKACDVDAECRLVSSGCCGACEPVQASSFVALNVATSPPPCPPIACGPCLEPSEVDRNREYFWPTCENHACTVTDLTQSEYAACSKDEDCFLRDGNDCCGSCDGSGFVPLSSTEYLSERCAAVDCAFCDSAPPPDLVARCDTSSGYCIKTVLLGL